MRKLLEPQERLSVALRLYVTPREAEAVDAMAGPYKRADILRRALALFVRTNYPELKENLRKDLDSGAK